MDFNLHLFPDSDLERIHALSLQILADPGMRIMSPALRQALVKRGAAVDETHQVVRFPAELVEETIAGMQAELRAGRTPLLLNGVVSSLSRGPIQAKFGGACLEYLDLESGQFRPPTRQDLVNMVRLGQALPEVATVGTWWFT